MPGHIKVSGAWKGFDKMHVKVSGTWKEVQSGYVKVSGTWKEFFTNILVTLSGATISDTDSPGPVEVRVRFNSDGTVDRYLSGVGSYQQISSGTDWIIPNGEASGTYEVRATLNNESGGGTKTGSLGTWLALSSNREWTLTRQAVSGSGTSVWDLDIEITDDGGSTILSTALYELESEII